LALTGLSLLAVLEDADALKKQDRIMKLNELKNTFERIGTG